MLERTKNVVMKEQFEDYDEDPNQVREVNYQVLHD